LPLAGFQNCQCVRAVCRLRRAYCLSDTYVDRHCGMSLTSALSWFITPDPSLNYNFIAKVFAALSIVSLSFFIAQYYFNVTTVTGFWIVPAPTLPAFFYSLYLDSRSIKVARSGRAARALVKKAD
jgi:hypothetical protein